MHPDGKMDLATYDLIGAAYSEVEALEPWLDNVESVADIAILSDEAVSNYYSNAKTLTFAGTSADTGAVRLMLEGKYLFDIIDTEEELGKYRLLILPDTIRLDEELEKKIRSFIDRGGKVLASGTSGLAYDRDEFVLDLGARFIGKSAFRPVYFKPKFDLEVLGPSAFVIYSQSYDIEAKGDVICERENPYFNRTTFAFSSHQHTPNDRSASYPAITVGRDGAYISTEIFSEYAEMGSLISKLIAHRVIDLMLGDNKTLVTDLPAQGICTLMRQKDEDRLICHALYASPVKRGTGIEVIEDIIPVYCVNMKLKTEKRPARVYSAPDMTDIDFEFKDGYTSYVIDKLDLHRAVVIEF